MSGEVRKFYEKTGLSSFMFSGCEAETDGDDDYHVTVFGDRIEIMTEELDRSHRLIQHVLTFRSFEEVENYYDVFDVLSTEDYMKRLKTLHS